MKIGKTVMKSSVFRGDTHIQTRVYMGIMLQPGLSGEILSQKQNTLNPNQPSKQTKARHMPCPAACLPLPSSPAGHPTTASLAQTRPSRINIPQESQLSGTEATGRNRAGREFCSVVIATAQGSADKSPVG